MSEMTEMMMMCYIHKNISTIIVIHKKYVDVDMFIWIFSIDILYRLYEPENKKNKTIFFFFASKFYFG